LIAIALSSVFVLPSERLFFVGLDRLIQSVEFFVFFEEFELEMDEEDEDEDDVFAVPRGLRGDGPGDGSMGVMASESRGESKEWSRFAL